MSEQHMNDQDIINLLGDLGKEAGYPPELLESRRNWFKQAVAALGLSLVAWSFLGLKGAFKLTSSAQMAIKLIMVSVVAAEVVAISAIYQDAIRDFFFPVLPPVNSVQLLPFDAAYKTAVPTRTAYPAPSLAPSITPVSTSTAIARLTPLPGVSDGIIYQDGGANSPYATPTYDKPGLSLGLTKTSDPQNDNNE